MSDDYQSAASEQGREFEDAVMALLKYAGWEIKDRRNRIEGHEIDIVAIDDEGRETWVECKGSFRGTVPGLMRNDTVKKAVGVAWSLKQRIPDRPRYILVTSHIPNDGTVGATMLRDAVRGGLFDEIIGVALAFVTPSYLR